MLCCCESDLSTSIVDKTEDNKFATVTGCYTVLCEMWKKDAKCVVREEVN